MDGTSALEKTYCARRCSAVVPQIFRMQNGQQTPLGGSLVVISGVISRVTIVISPIRGLITPLITTHEPPSTQ